MVCICTLFHCSLVLSIAALRLFFFLYFICYFFFFFFFLNIPNLPIRKRLRYIVTIKYNDDLITIARVRSWLCGREKLKKLHFSGIKSVHLFICTKFFQYFGSIFHSCVTKWKRCDRGVTWLIFSSIQRIYSLSSWFVGCFFLFYFWIPNKQIKRAIRRQ